MSWDEIARGGAMRLNHGKDIRDADRFLLTLSIGAIVVMVLAGMFMEWIK